MSKIVRIPEDVVVLVCDARKALLLRNAGAVAQPELQIEASLEYEPDEDAPGISARPGRRFDGGAAAASGGPRSAMETPDLDAKQAESFAEVIVAALIRRQKKAPIGGLILAAPPAFLGVLRQKMSDNLGKLIREEVDKELAEMPLPDIQRVLLKSLE